jgi:hypothetical protein
MLSFNRSVIALVLVFSVAGLAAVARVGAADAQSESCTPGVRQINGSSARVFCGPAKATVRLGQQTLRFSPGECAKSGGMFVVNLGTFVADSHSPLPYFGLLISKPKAGTYTGQTLSYRSAGKSRSSSSTTVVLKTLRSGTFSANVFGVGRVTGAFSC